MPEIGFLIFWFFFSIFFRIFFPGSSMNGIRVLNFFFLFLGQSHPILAKNNAGKSFFNFLNFLAIFFGISFHRSSMNEIHVWNYFLSFSAYLIPFCLKIMPERVFLISWIFLLFFSEFPSTGRVWTKFMCKIIFSLSWPISSLFG